MTSMHAMRARRGSSRYARTNAPTPAMARASASPSLGQRAQYGAPRLVDDAVVHGPQQCLAAREVLVEVPRRDAGGGADALDRGAAYPAVPKRSSPAAEQPLAPILAALDVRLSAVDPRGPRRLATARGAGRGA